MCITVIWRMEAEVTELEINSQEVISIPYEVFISVSIPTYSYACISIRAEELSVGAAMAMELERQEVILDLVQNICRVGRWGRRNK